MVDGETDAPHFLHGINGEDHISFAYFGQGKNLPYSEAFDNDTRQLRIHLERPYAFDGSFQISTGALQGLKPRAVAFWYAGSPADETVGLEQSEGAGDQQPASIPDR